MNPSNLFLAKGKYSRLGSLTFVVKPSLQEEKFRIQTPSSRLIGEKWFDLVWFHGTLTIVGYLMPNPVYTHILNIKDLVG